MLDLRRATHSRRRALAVAAGLAGTALAACQRPTQTGQGGEKLPEAGKGPVTVVAYLGMSDQQVNLWDNDIAAPYRQQRPNVTLEAIPQPGGGTIAVVEKLVSLIAGGTAPDIWEGPRHAEWQVPKDLLEDVVDGFVRRDKYDTKVFNQKEFESRAMYQGRIWQIPWKYGGNTLVLLLNRDIFDGAGVPLPATDLSKAWTWEQWVEVLVKLTKTGPDGQIEQFGLASYGWYLGSWPLPWQTDWLSQDLKTVTCDVPEMIECYTRWHELFFRYHVLPQRGEAARLFGNVNLFQSGKAAMVFAATGSWSTYTQEPQINMAAAPTAKVKITTPDVNVHSFGIVRGSKQPADAWEAIKYFNQGSRLAIWTQRMPANLNDLEPYVRETIKSSPGIDAHLIKQVLETHVPQTNLGRHPNQDEMLRLLNPAMDNEFLENKVAPAQFLRRLKPELQAIAEKQ
jgi:multiple sugar transport system substrate-binding protein